MYRLAVLQMQEPQEGSAVIAELNCQQWHQLTYLCIYSSQCHLPFLNNILKYSQKLIR